MTNHSTQSARYGAKSCIKGLRGFRCSYSICAEGVNNDKVTVVSLLKSSVQKQTHWCIRGICKSVCLCFGSKQSILHIKYSKTERKELLVKPVKSDTLSNIRKEEQICLLNDCNMKRRGIFIDLFFFTNELWSCARNTSREGRRRRFVPVRSDMFWAWSHAVITTLTQTVFQHSLSSTVMRLRVYGPILCTRVQNKNKNNKNIGRTQRNFHNSDNC